MSLADSGQIAAATTGTDVLVLGPLPYGSRLDGVNVWFDQTDDLGSVGADGIEADTFHASIAVSDRGAASDDEFTGVRPLIQRLPLQSLGTPGTMYFRLAWRSKRERFVLVRVRANNAGAASWRFGASADFSTAGRSDGDPPRGRNSPMPTMSE